LTLRVGLRAGHGEGGRGDRDPLPDLGGEGLGQAHAEASRLLKTPECKAERRRRARRIVRYSAARRPRSNAVNRAFSAACYCMRTSFLLKRPCGVVSRA